MGGACSTYPRPFPKGKGDFLVAISGWFLNSTVEDRNEARPEGVITMQRIRSEKLQEARRMRRNPTPAERALWERLRANGPDGWHFRRQQLIQGFIVDFYCHLAGLAIEVDGSSHLSKAEHDLERTVILESIGVKVIRFTNEEVMGDVDQVLKTISTIAQSRTQTPAPL
jgi:very-short-patch-repair endonuclease